MVKKTLFLTLLISFQGLFATSQKLGPFGSIMYQSDLVVKVKLIRSTDEYALVKPLEIYHGVCAKDSIWVHTTSFQFTDKIYHNSNTMILFLENLKDNHSTRLKDIETNRNNENIYRFLDYELVRYNHLGFACQKINNDSVYYSLDPFEDFDYCPKWQSLSDYELFLKTVFQDEKVFDLTKNLVNRLSISQNDDQIIHDLNMLYYLELTEYQTVFEELKNDSNMAIKLALTVVQLSIEDQESYSLLHSLMQMNEPFVTETVIQTLSKKNSLESIRLLLEIVDPDNNGKITIDEVKIENFDDQFLEWFSVSGISNCENKHTVFLAALSALVNLKYNKMYPLLEELSYYKSTKIAHIVTHSLYKVDPESFFAVLKREINDTLNSREYIFNLIEHNYYQFSKRPIFALFENYFMVNKAHDYMDIYFMEETSFDTTKYDLKRKHFKDMIHHPIGPHEDYNFWLERMGRYINSELISGLKSSYYNALYPLCGISYDYYEDTSLFELKVKQEFIFEQKIETVLAQNHIDSGIVFSCNALLDTTLYRNKGIIQFDKNIVFEIPNIETDENYVFNLDLEFAEKKRHYYAKLFQLPLLQVSVCSSACAGVPQTSVHHGGMIIQDYLAVFGNEKDIRFLENLIHFYPEKYASYELTIKEIKEFRL